MKNKKNKLLKGVAALAILCSFLSCKQFKTKFFVNNLLNGNEIDVTNLIVNKGFVPIYCNKKKEIICALRNPNPNYPNPSYESVLKDALAEWQKNKNVDFDTDVFNNVRILENVLYQYSYFIADNPIDVFMINLNVNNNEVRVYFRIDRGDLMLPLDEDGWVIFSEE